MTKPCHRTFSDKPFDYCQEPVTVQIKSETGIKGFYCSKCAKELFGIIAPEEPIDFQPKKEK